MLWTYYQIPAAVLLLGGILAAFAGYRLFRLVLAVYGFILGALIATSLVGSVETVTMVLAGLGGGAAGALILILGYFLGVALVGAAAGAALGHLIWTHFGGETNLLILVAGGVAGAVGALIVQRLLIILVTAFIGAWTALVGGLTLLGDGVAEEAILRGDFWTVYLLPALEGTWVLALWLVLGLAGTVVQLGTTAARAEKERRRWRVRSRDEES